MRKGILSVSCVMVLIIKLLRRRAKNERDDDSSLSFRPQNKDIYLKGREGIILIYCPIVVLFFELYTRTLSHLFFFFTRRWCVDET